MARGSGRTDSTGKIRSKDDHFRKEMDFFLSLWGERGDEPVLSHEEPGATDHSSVRSDPVRFRTLS